MTNKTCRIVALAGLAAIAGCARTDKATTVVNRSASTVTITYVDAQDGHARRLDLAPGASGRLWQNESISTLTALAFATGERTYDLANWDIERRRLTCRGDCVITWQPDRKIHIASGRT